MQTHISRILLLLILFTHTLFGCALCTLYSPETKVLIKVDSDDKKIKTADITWVLTKEFSDQLKSIYDTNQNNYIDKDELIPIEQSLLDYIVPKHYLTHISYDKVIDKKNSRPINVVSKKAYIKNSLLHFDYRINLNYDIKKDNVLYMSVNDDENYFILLLMKNVVEFKSKYNIKKVFNRQSVAFYMEYDGASLDEKQSKQVIEKKPKEPEEKLQTLKETKKEQKSESLLISFTKKVKEYLLKIENGDDYALFILLGVSFLYGIIHALGPGHGKSLAFTYFSSNKSSFSKAFIISQASAFIHIVGALILVMVSVFLLQSVINNFVNDSVAILTKLSAVMIIVLALYILYNKLNHKDCSCSSCCSNHSPTPTWSATKPANTLKPNFMKKDLYFVLTAGLIPCPGTVVLFIYAFVLKTYFAVILASIAISFGMGLIIFAASFLGVSINKVSEKSYKLTNALEILAPIVMLILGVFLYINANIF